MSELRLPWHAGRTTGRALYDGDGPDDLIGVMDTRELAAVVVDAVNTAYAAVRGAEGQPAAFQPSTPDADDVGLDPVALVAALRAQTAEVARLRAALTAILARLRQGGPRQRLAIYDLAETALEGEAADGC